MKKIFIPFLFALSLLMVACGGENPQTLEAKKRILQTKKDNLKQLSKEIAQLESEINELDPSQKAKVKKIPVTVEGLESETFEHFVKTQGVVEANKNIAVSALSSGRITAIYVKEGQPVKKGQLLAQLDDAVMKASIAEVKTQLDLAQTLFQKQENLWNQKIGTEIQYLTAKNQKESLEKRLKTLQEQRALNKIKAPISGTIDEIFPKVGELASPGVPVFRIVNPYDLSIQADFPESYSPYIKRGDLVEVSFPILNKKIQGKVNTVGQSINPINRSFKVEVKLPNDRSFKPNMYGELSINDRNIQDAISVPLNLIQKSDVGSFVFTAVQDTGSNWIARRMPIETGLTSGDNVQITSGLKEGDRLIVTGYKDLSDGQPINISNSLVTNQ